jgi:hypothetical protein
VPLKKLFWFQIQQMKWWQWIIKVRFQSIVMWWEAENGCLFYSHLNNLLKVKLLLTSSCNFCNFDEVWWFIWKSSYPSNYAPWSWWYLHISRGLIWSCNFNEDWTSVVFHWDPLQGNIMNLVVQNLSIMSMVSKFEDLL